MSVDERARHELHARLDELLGPEPAGTLMSYLPPVGWADVATKRDLESFEHRLEAVLYREVGALRTEMGSMSEGLRQELATQTRTFLFWTSGLLLSLAGIAFAAVQTS